MVAKRLLQLLALVCLVLAPQMARAEEASSQGAPADHGIPVVNIDIDGGDDEFQKMNTSEGHTYQCTGSLSLAVPEGYADACGLTEPQGFAGLEVEYIRGRGNSTWKPQGGRNPYKIKLGKKAALLGPAVGANKHWLLLASSYDSSGLRNRLVALMGTRLGLAYTPVGTHVDLVVNGEYRGEYYLCEQVRVGESRVDVDELGPSDVEEPAISGGYLLSMMPKADEPAGNRITTSRGVQFCGDTPPFASNDPSDELGLPEQKAYIAAYLQEVEDAVWDGGPWADYMDADSAAAYWWVQEFVKNTDAYLTPSTYLYKERGGKLYWGPLWDFDQSMGSMSAGTDGLASREMDWIDFLRTYDEGFARRLREVWLSYDAVLEDVVREGGVLDQLAHEVRASWQADFDLWVKDTPAGPYAMDFDGEIDALRGWIVARRAWINEHVDTDLGGVFSAVTFVVDGKVVDVRHARTGSFLYKLADVPQRDGMLFVGWQDQGGALVEDGVGVEGDVVLTARYVPVGEAELARDVFFGSHDFWTALDAPDVPSFAVYPAEAQERYLRWESSDPLVAEVDTYGSVVAHAAGTTTITATLANGTSRSYVLHVAGASSELSTHVDSLTARATSLELRVGEFGQVPVDVVPQANNMTLPVYDCADPSVAEVDDIGAVYAVAPGTTQVRAYDPNNPEATFATYTVVVSEAEPEEEPGENPGGDESGDGEDEEPGGGASEEGGENPGAEKPDAPEQPDGGEGPGAEKPDAPEQPDGGEGPGAEKPDASQAGEKPQEGATQAGTAQTGGAPVVTAAFGATAIRPAASGPVSRAAASAALPRTADASLAGTSLCAACGLLAVFVGRARARRRGACAGRLV